MNRQLTRITRIFIITVIVTTVAMLTYSCHSDRREHLAMDRAEQLMETYPDSSLAILDSLDPANIHGRAGKARFALLRSMALDKNYIDTTDFSVLQPAIDYYLSHGNPDQKLRTYYYQGCIYINRNEEDSAMIAFLNGLELNDKVTDSLTLCRLYMSKGVLHYIQNEISEDAKSNLKAGDIAKKIGNTELQLKANIKAWDCFVLLHDKSKADSLKALCIEECNLQHNNLDRLIPQLIIHVNEFGSTKEKRDSLNKYASWGQWTQKNIGVLVHGYSQIGEGKKAMCYLDSVVSPVSRMDSLYYHAIKAEALEAASIYEDALRTYRVYMHLAEEEHAKQLDHNITFVCEQFELEKEKYRQINRRDRIIACAIILVLILTILSIWIFYRLRVQRLITSTLQSKIHELELEESRLTRIIDENAGNRLPSSLRNILKQRVGLLNGIIASEITKNESHSKTFDNWLNAINKDKSEFLASIRETMTAMYPEMMRELVESELTEREIDYVCLYAIGLTGKEIGVYLNNKNHYNIAASIRKKLDINDSHVHIGKFISEMFYSSGRP